MSLSRDNYERARDFLLEHRTDYHAAREGFAWPEIEDGFNWALDWFDGMARGLQQPALVVFSDQKRESVSFDQMMRKLLDCRGRRRSRRAFDRRRI